MMVSHQEKTREMRSAGQRHAAFHNILSLQAPAYCEGRVFQMHQLRKILTQMSKITPTPYLCQKRGKSVALTHSYGSGSRVKEQSVIRPKMWRVR